MLRRHFFDWKMYLFVSRHVFLWLETIFSLSHTKFVSRDRFLLNFSSFNQFFALAHKILCREIDFYIFEAIFWFLFIQKLKTSFQISTCVIKSQSRSHQQHGFQNFWSVPLKNSCVLNFRLKNYFFSIFFKKIEKNAKKGPIAPILSNRVTFFWLFCTLRTHFEFFFYSGDQIRIFESHSVVWMRFAILTQVRQRIQKAYYLQIWAPK